ncbi:MAG: DUF92 domain-containing protein [Ardenticatenaceae bacterium]|nr:DUF92 domain-containing protein [Anaerolineales bacterium]MCB9006416.1 DUF92 domain-containing protein [Ardenticatenaceae bacterium]
MINQIVLAFFLSGLVAVLAYWRGSLAVSGAASALLVGTIIFGFGGWVWGVLLALFFISSSLLSHYKEKEKQAVAEKFDKGHRRDWGQVLANGGAGTIVALLQGFFPSLLWLPLFVGAMATVTADTWATELGTLSQKPPRLITTGRAVPVGTSGGISLFGTAVSFIGGLLIGFTTGLLSQTNILGLTLTGGLGGLAGSLFDSFLGATVQQIYYCDHCQKETEKKVHCHQPTRPLRGWRWMNNDLVNFFSSIAGGATAVLVYSLLVA